MSRSSEHGFSLIIVMFALIIMAVVGGVAAAVTSSDAGTAGARAQRAHALLAAETGIALLTASGNAFTIEALITSKDKVLSELPGIHADTDTVADKRLAYLVLKGAEGAFVVEGQVLEPDGRVISRARLSGRVSTFLGGDGYEGQVGLGPRSDGVSDETGAGAQGKANPL